MQERQHRSSASRNSDTIASFLLKTYEILEVKHLRGSTPRTKRSFAGIRTMSGSQSSTSSPSPRKSFPSTSVIPTSPLSSGRSFPLTQLNMYDFHKVKQDNDMLVFKNPLFCRGEQQKLRFIKRKATKKAGGIHRRHHSSDRTDQSKVSTVVFIQCRFTVG